MHFSKFAFPIILSVTSLNLYANGSADFTTASLYDLTIEELLNIKVTSQKRTEKVQEISLSVTALDTSNIDEWTVFDMTRLDQQVPGLVMGRSGYDPRPAMRGARTQQVENNDSAVSVYHNGVYRPRHAQAMMPFVDLNRIEVMRGPQGTLFGRNSFGGTVNVIVKQPSLLATEYGVAATFGDYEQRRIEGFVNATMGSSSAIRLSGLTERRDPFVENTFDRDAGLRDKDTTFFRGQLYTEPSVKSSLLIKFEYWNEDSNGNGAFGYKLLGIPLNADTGLTNPNAPVLPRIGRDNVCGSNCGRYGAGLDIIGTSGFDDAAVPLTDPYHIASDYKSMQDIDERTVTAEYNYKLAIADLKVLVANMDFEDLRLEDADFSHYSSVIEGYQMDSQTQTAELQLTSKQQGAWEWVAGLYYLKEELEYAFLWMDIIDLVDNKPDPSAEAKNAWADWLSQLQIDTTSYAIYGQAHYAFNDNLRGILGLRYTHDDREWDILGQNPDNLSELDFSVPSVSNADNHWNSNTWRAGSEYDLSKRSMLYATVSTGFLAGNYQNGDASYDEQTVIAYEIGNKNVLLDDNLRVNLSLYFNDYSDLLATHFIDIGGTTQGEVSNAGAIEAYGLEIEIDWLVNSQLRLGLRGEISRTEYGDFTTSNPFQEGGEAINGIANLFQLDGEQAMYSPDYAFTLLASYVIPLGELGYLTPTLLVHLSDDYRVSDEPYAFAQQDSYTKVDANLTWSSEGYRWKLKLYSTNITDEEILVRATRFGGNTAAVDYADPRMFGLRLSYNYGS